uniref:Uncharacterized protein n=1 Tax=Daphnia magna TaxID=35525 RepID=A0A0P4Y2G3_9CRUS
MAGQGKSCFSECLHVLHNAFQSNKFLVLHQRTISWISSKWMKALCTGHVSCYPQHMSLKFYWWMV